MLSRRSFGMMSTLPLIALGLASESSASSASAASATAPRPLALSADGAPAKVLELTGGDGALTSLAQAGLKSSPSAAPSLPALPRALRRPRPAPAWERPTSRWPRRT